MGFESKSAGKVALLVRFEWGDGHVARYTSWDEDVTLPDTTVWQSEVRMEVLSGECDGSISDKPWSVRMPARSPIDKLVRPYAWAPVRAWLGTVDLADLATVKAKWAGPVTKTVDGVDGLTGIVDVEISGWKSLINYPAGLELKEGCSNVFGLSPCDFDVAGHRKAVTVTAVNGYAATVTGDVSVPAGFSTYWEAGTIRVDGLALKILGRTGSTFRLNRLPPPEWVGAAGTIEPGCLKKIKNCRERGQERHFNGIGISVPAYDPTIDDPTGSTETG